MAEKPFVSIISPVRNAERTIDTTIQYLLKVDYPRDKMEIVFADGGSTDKTVEIIKKWQEKFAFIRLELVPDSKSPGHARNAALKVVKGEYILFTDGDCAPHNDWIDKMIEPFIKDPQVGMVGGEVYTLRTDATNDTETYCEATGFLSIGNRVGMKNGGYYPEIKKDLPSEINGSQTCPFFATANAAVSKKAAMAIGNEFWHEPTGEDVDFNLRVLKKGFKLFFQPSAVVDHMHRATPQMFYKQLYGYGYGHPLLLKMHAKKVCEIYFAFGKGFSFTIPYPVPGIIYIGDFMLMNFLGISTILTLVVNLLTGGIPGIVGNFIGWGTQLALAVIFALRFFAPVFKIKPGSKLLTWMKIAYLSKWNFIKGGLDGQKKFGTLNVEG
jgi:dolichyl N-acetyl-alpha-D-glucosaminyl phosphate 3-beta-D-2,3-diacetamido-2,3-dideoxy-beta-D-glucuronosyltransferase